MTLSIRARLTFWYTAVLSLVLAVCAVAFYLTQARARLARVDEELRRVAGLLARTVGGEIGEGLELREAASEALDDIEFAGLWLAVFDADSALVGGRWEGLPQGRSADGTRATDTVTAGTGASAYRVHRSRRRQDTVAFEVGVAEPLAKVEDELRSLREALLGSLVFGLVLAAGGGYWIARGALRPVEAMAGQAAGIGVHTPGERLAVPHPEDELGRLARAFNDLLARLEQALLTQRQFMADASHELRTPVSVARTAIEVTLGRSGRSEPDYREALEVVAAQMRRLTRLVEDMFTLARADAAGLPLDRTPFYLDELLGECVKEAQMLARAREVKLELAAGADLALMGDEPRLRQLFMNLLDNAVRHTAKGGLVQVAVAAFPSVFEVSVADGGPGIPEADRERIFSRFVRLDPARAGDGAGLGLPIARAIAEAHGGTLILARSDASGSRFLVRLPRTNPA